jgi:hypothetical protein
LKAFESKGTSAFDSEESNDEDYDDVIVLRYVKTESGYEPQIVEILNPAHKLIINDVS